MSKRFQFGKGLAIWAVLSALIIVAGVAVYAIFGFNRAETQVNTLSVGYDAVIAIDEDKQETLAKLCEDALSSAGIKLEGKRVDAEVDANYYGETGDEALVYTFEHVGTDELLPLVSAIESKVAAETSLSGARVVVNVHSAQASSFQEADWRGAVALAVAAVVVLVYIGFRFGLGKALAGLVALADDTLLTFAILALSRIPVYAYTPLVFVGTAAVLSLFFWIIQSAKMRENFKDPAYAALKADEAVAESVASSYKTVLWIALSVAAVLVIFGAVAASGVRLFMLSALIPVAVSVYSSLLLAPAVYAPIKAKLDRITAKQKRYAGKKKAEPESEA